MKKTINGKRYDTDTARLIGGDVSDYGRNDFRWWDEYLYRKKTWEFFLAGKGGPMTRWARFTANGACAGDGVAPLSIDEAREWAEEHLDADTVEEVFNLPSEEEEGAPKVIQSYSIAPKTINGLRYLAQNLGISRSEIIDQLVEKAVGNADIKTED